MTSVRRPAWWCYPERCPRGHDWGPGQVTVGWMPCDCAEALSQPGRGHLWVRCRAGGCPAIWYQPPHAEPDSPGGGQASKIGKDPHGEPPGTQTA